MKKYLAALFLIVAFLAIFVPLASSNPDGLEKVAQTFGADEQKLIWSGLMSDYSLSFIGNSCISTLIAGVVGVILVFSSAILLSKMFPPKKRNSVSK